MSRGFFAVGIYHPKTEANVGMLWRAADLYDAAFVFTIGARYRHGSDDTMNTTRHKPLWHFPDFDQFHAVMPSNCPVVGVELDERATPLPEYTHPIRAAYLLGNENTGIPADILTRCADIVYIPTARPFSMNVAMAGSTVLYDRHIKN